MQIIELNDEYKEIAKKNIACLKDEKTRKRAYVSSLGINEVAQYLASKDFQPDDTNALHLITKFLEEFEIADISVNNLSIDSRVVISDEYNEMWIPKNHFLYGIYPDIYLGVKINQELSEAEIIGFVLTSELNDMQGNENYYIIDKSELKSLDELPELLNTLPSREFFFTEEEKDKAEGLFLSYLEDELSEADKDFLIKHLVACKESREKINLLYNFENIFMEFRKEPELLKDRTLDIFVGEFPAQEEELTIEIGNDQEEFSETDISKLTFKLPEEINIKPEVALTFNEGQKPILEDNELINAQKNVKKEILVEEETAREEEQPENQDDETEGNQEDEVDTTIEFVENIEEELVEDTLETFDLIEEVNELEQMVNSQILDNKDSDVELSHEVDAPVEFVENIEEELAEDTLETFDLIEEVNELEQMVSSQIIEEDEKLVEIDDQSEPEQEEKLEDISEEELINLVSEDEDLEKSEENSNEDLIDLLEESADIVESEKEVEQEDQLEEVSEDELISLVSEVEDLDESGEDTLKEELLDLLEENTDSIEIDNEVEQEEQLEDISEDELISLVSEVEDLDESGEDTSKEELLDLLEEDADLIESDSEIEQEEQLEEISEEELISLVSEDEELEKSEDESKEYLLDLLEEDTDSIESDNEVEQEEQLEVSSEDELISLVTETEGIEESKEYISKEDLLDLLEEDADSIESENQAESEEQFEEVSEEELLSLLENDDEQDLEVVSEESSSTMSDDIEIPEEYKDVTDPEALKLLFEDDNEQDDNLLNNEENFENSLSEFEQIDIDDESKQKSKKVLKTAAVIGLLGIMAGLGGFYLYKDKIVSVFKKNDYVAEHNVKINDVIKKTEPKEIKVVPSEKNIKVTVDKTVKKTAVNKAKTVTNDLPVSSSKSKAIKPVVPAKVKPKKENINDIMAKALMKEHNAVRISKISWEIGSSLVGDPALSKYLTFTGRAVKINLSQELLLAKDRVFSNLIKVDVDYTNRGVHVGSRIKQSSGSQEIDEIVLTTVDDTLKYAKMPAINTDKVKFTATLVINL